MSASGCQSKSCSEALRVQCGQDGAGRRKSGPIAYSATVVESKMRALHMVKAGI